VCVGVDPGDDDLAGEDEEEAWEDKRKNEGGTMER